MKRKLPKAVRKAFDSEQLQIDPTFKSSLKQQLFKEKNMANVKKGALHNLKEHKLVPLGAVIAALVLVGGASALVVNTKNNNDTKKALELPQDLSEVLAVNDIRTRAAEGLADGITITGIELEDEDEGLLYKVKYSDGTIRYFDAKTGKPIQRDNITERDEAVPADFVPGISLQQARETAEKQRPGIAVTKIELEVEDGVVIYSVRFSDDGRVDINATSGEVVRVRKGDDSSDDSSDDVNDDESSDQSGNEDGNEHEDSNDDTTDDSKDSDDESDNDSDKNNEEEQEDNSGHGSN